MTDPLRLRLLEREIEFMTHFALFIAEDLDTAAQQDQRAEIPILIQGLVATTLKISHLLWRFGRRVTDRIGVDEAWVIRQRLSAPDDSPLTPARIAPVVRCLTMPREELLAAFDADARTLTLGAEIHALRPLITALREVREAVTEGEAEGALR